METKHIRIIPKLDIKGPNLVKGVHLEGLRVLGRPEDFALKYYQDGADELIYIDLVASLYGRSNLVEIVQRTADRIFIPLTVGGGIRSVEDMKTLLRAGADKLALNTALFQDISLISQGANRFGSQCMVVYIEAKQMGNGRYGCMHTNARESTGQDVIEWAKRVEAQGAGEILLTFVDTEGTGKGMDTDFVKKLVSAVSLPVIVNGGIGSREDIYMALEQGADAVSAASIFHYYRLEQLKEETPLSGEGNTDYIKLSRSSTTGFLKNKIIPVSIKETKALLDKTRYVCRQENQDSDKPLQSRAKSASKVVVVVDYDMGNIFSLNRAIKAIGQTPIVTSDPKVIETADYLLLPGVGAFPRAMESLEKRNLADPVKNHAASGRPLLGICLGMQLLFSVGEEIEDTKGLGLISGRVKKLFSARGCGSVKLPHFGWNRLCLDQDLYHHAHQTWGKTLFQNLKPEETAYFVHSYACYPDDTKAVLSVTPYGDENFCSAIQKDNIAGCQFHPELSSNAGLSILASFFNIF